MNPTPLDKIREKRQAQDAEKQESAKLQPVLEALEAQGKVLTEMCALLKRIADCTENSLPGNRDKAYNKTQHGQGRSA